jgi:alpha-glucosidase
VKERSMKAVLRLTRLSALPISLALIGCSGSSRTTPYEVTTSAAHVRVTVPVAGVFRVQLSASADFPEIPSYAVDPAALTAGETATVETSDAGFVVHSGAAALRVTKDPLKLELLDAAGDVVAQETAPIAWTNQTAADGAPIAQTGATISWELPANEHVYGLGDKVGGGMDRRGHQYKMWNTDHYLWTPTGAGSDPLYKSIPDLLFVKEGGQAHGLFIDNPSRATVDVGATSAGVLTYAAERATTMDLYVIAGPDPKDVIKSYTALTGRTPLPPLWSLGYNQSRFSYLDEADTREVANHLRADSIPADVIWLDLRYQEHNAPFTVDTTTFPNFPGMVSDFSAMGLNTVLITDLHIRQNDLDPQYASGKAGDHFVLNQDGTLLAGGVWPWQDVPAPFKARSVFPEFTLKTARDWWGTLFTQFASDGVAGFWNDMNEPSIPFDPELFPEGTFHDDTLHRLEGGTAGTSADHVTIHNAYGLLNARATYEGALALRPNLRPFVLSRAAYAGSQRWGATWTGDNTANREHLAVTIPQLINLGVSGYAYAGADVGGYSLCPWHYTTTGVDASLLVEWMELAALQPFFRNHSELGTCRREPWLLGPAVEARLRKAIERRYKLLPYIYTAFEESSRNGLPVMRPLWLEYPGDTTTLTNDKAFLLGRDLLVAPKLVPGTDPYDVTLPQAAWWDTLTGELNPGGGTVTITPPDDDSLRIFARAGAIIPSQPLTQMAGATPQGALTVEVWPGPDCSGSLYQDDGRSLDYQSGPPSPKTQTGQTGATMRIAYACEQTATGVHVTSAATGSFPSWWTATRLLIHGASQGATITSSRGPAPPSSYDGVTHTLTLTFDGSGADWDAQATWPTATTVTATPTTISLDVGTTSPLPASNRPVTWTVPAGSACTIVNATLRATTVGACTLTATAGAAHVDVPVIVTPYLFQVTTTPTDLTVVHATNGSDGSDGSGGLVIHLADPVQFVSTRPAIWSVDDSEICRVATDGLLGTVTGTALGTCVVTAQSPVEPAQVFHFTVHVDARPASMFVDPYAYPKNVYVKGGFPSYGTAGQWTGSYDDMMRLTADHVWQWTWSFTADDIAALPLNFKFVADQSSWPPDQMFEPNPKDPPASDGLSGPLIDEASRGLAGDGSSNNVITVEAGTYLFTFFEPVGGAVAHYTIVKQ